MAQNQYHVSQINPELISLLTSHERATMYYLNISHQLGHAIGELIGMGVDEKQLRAAIDTIFKNALETRKPASVLPPPHGRG